MGAYLRFETVTRRFGSFTAVSGVTLDVGQGEIFSLLGPSGCGKTTLLRMVAGFDRPDTGRILLDGKDITALPPDQRPVNTVFQSYALFPHLPIRENIAFGPKIAKKNAATVRRDVDEMLELVDLKAHADKKPSQLSGGQKQRVAIARALVNKPKVLLLDEPLAALDLKLRQRLLVELDAIHDEVGITFIYVTHDQGEAMSISDRIAVMNKGVIEQIGAPSQIYEAPRSSFVAAFIGDTNFIDGRIIFAIAFRPALPAGGIGPGWSVKAVRALADPSYPALFARTLWISALTTFACIAVSLPVAYAIARLTPVWRSRALMLVIVPFWTNFVIRVFSWQQILHAEGYLADGLRFVGFIGENDRLLGNMPAVVIVSIYTFLPFTVLPLFAAAEKFDFGLLDAARDLGARPMRAFFSVFVPGIRQGIVTAFLVVFIPMLGSYVIPDMVGGTNTQMIGNKIAQRNFTNRNLPEAAALSGALALLVLAPMFLRRKEKSA